MTRRLRTRVRAAAPTMRSAHAPAAARSPLERRPAADPVNLQWMRQQGIRAKLAISQPGDPDEKDADQAADDFMAGQPIHRKCASCGTDDDSIVARKATDAAPTRAGAPLFGLRGGQPLPPSTRREYERFFAADLAGVRVHTGAQAYSAAGALRARAFAVGPNIAFARGEWSPHTDDGARLLAHELAHVVQGGARPRDRVARDPDGPAPHTPPAGESVQELYDTVLHLWNLRTGRGEPLTDEERKLAEDEDIGPRLVEEACGAEPLVIDTPDAPATPAPGLLDPSGLFFPASDAGDTFLYELVAADDDAIALAEAYAQRVVLQIIQTKADAFLDEEDFWEFHDEITARACIEKDTLDYLGEDFEQKTQAFPRTWAKHLQKDFMPGLDLGILETFRQRSLTRLDEAARAVAPWLVEKGLPIGFKESLALKSPSPAELIRIMRGYGGSAGLIDGFFKAEEEALDDELKLVFARRWLAWGREIVQAVGTARKNVDYQSYVSYFQKISAESLIRDRRSTNAFATTHLNLDQLEYDISFMSYAAATVARWLRQRYLETLLDGQFAIADQTIAGMGGDARLGRAQDWRSAKDFDSAARSFLWDSFDIGDAAIAAGKDMLLNIGIGLLTGGWGVLVKEAGQAIGGVAESSWKIMQARDAAREAKGVPQLQRASANLALITTAEGLSIAMNLAQVPGLLKQAKHLRAPKAALPKDDIPAVKKTDPWDTSPAPREDVPAIRKPPEEPKAAAPPKDVPAVRKPPDEPSMLKPPKDDVPAVKKPSAVEPELGPGAARPVRHADMPDHWRRVLSEDDAALLERTRKIDSDKLDDVLGEKELKLAEKGPARDIDSGGYVKEVEMPNGHHWREQVDGTWCRFTTRKCFRRQSRYEEGSSVTDVTTRRPYTKARIDEARTQVVERPKVNALDRTGHRGLEDHQVPDDIILRVLNDPQHVRVGANGNWIFYRNGTVVVTRPGANYVGANQSAQVITAFGRGGKVPPRHLNEMRRQYGDPKLESGADELPVNLNDYIAQNRGGGFDSFKVWP